jgi:hypothetical protein
MKKFVRLGSILLARKDGDCYVWIRDDEEEHTYTGNEAAIAKIYNGEQLYGWVLLSVKNYYDKIQG